MINEAQEMFDDTGKKTDAFLAELMGEEDKEKKAAQKKKEKKHRAKLQKPAEKEGCTVGELESVFKRKEEQKKQDEREREIALLRAEEEAERAIQREKAERIAAIQAQRAEELAAVEAEREQERRE